MLAHIKKEAARVVVEVWEVWISAGSGHWKRGQWSNHIVLRPHRSSSAAQSQRWWLICAPNDTTHVRGRSLPPPQKMRLSLCVPMDEKQLMKECKNSVITQLAAPSSPRRWVEKWMLHYPIKYEKEFMRSHLGLWAWQSLLNSSVRNAILNVRECSVSTQIRVTNMKKCLEKHFTWIQTLKSCSAGCRWCLFLRGVESFRPKLFPE